jgi:Tfp pilus assembly protein PilV
MSAAARSRAPGVRGQGTAVVAPKPHRARPGGMGFGNYRAGVRPRGSSPALAPQATKTQEKAAINRRTPKGRRGVSLMEVLISTFVLSVGLMGLASLLPLGRFAVVETNKADYSGACGRAAMRDVEIRRMLYAGAPSVDPRWVDGSGNASSTVTRCMNSGAFAIDPLGMTSGATDDLGVLPRVNLVVPGSGAYSAARAQQVFLCKDDLSFTIPDNARTRRNFYDAGGGTTTDPSQAAGSMHDGHYSWLLTVSPAASEGSLQANSRRLYNVSVAVCYRRDFAGEQALAVSEFVGNIGYGGGTIRVADPGFEIKEGEWLLLCHASPAPGYPAVAKWYRVVSAGGSPATQITLQGPDWDTSQAATAVLIPTVLGVYSTVVELDNDPLWSY